MTTDQSLDLNSVGERARRRIMRRIMPYLFVLFIIAYLDRVNVGYAALQMKGDLAFTDDVLGLGAGIFFIGYFLLEIPGSILVERWSARGWIARILISWGIVAILMGFVRTRNEFYLLRFLLGAAEAGFFPGIMVYFTHWFRYQDRAKAVAMFMAAIPIANIVGSPLSGLLLGMNHFGLAGWRWLFIIEGAPAIIFGVVTIFYLTDRPPQAKWLAEDERKWITDELDREQQAKHTVHPYRILQAFRNREVILLTLAYFFIVTSVYGFTFWLPTIIKKLSGVSNLKVTLISGLPYCLALVAILLIGWSSDRLRERRWHTAVCMMVSGFGLLLSLAAGDHVGLAVAAFCLAAAGMYGYLPGFWALPTSFLTGTAAAASIGLINSVGNLGGFAGPYVVGYLSKRTNSYVGGVIYLSLSALVAAGLVLSLRATRRKRSPE
ncbi:MAG: transporter, family, tartrate transporter [Blastocatellia bacterium]|jgi:D-galactonate transporter|nr:transporter, family, tartrate transporter [Blastocatellia bacterium]